MTTETTGPEGAARRGGPSGPRRNWRARVLLAAVIVVLLLVPITVEMARGVPVGEAVLGLGNWIVGGVCVLGGRIHVERERSR